MKNLVKHLKNGMMIALSLLLCLNLSLLVDAVHFSRKPQEQYLQAQGFDLELPCHVNRRDVNCAWLVNGTIKYPTPGKYEFSTSNANGDCGLVIRNLSYPKDNAEWQCQVPSISDVGVQWPKTNVVVLVKPSAPRIIFDKEKFNRIVADQESNISCESEGGNPPPSLEWYLNGENISSHANKTVDRTRVISSLRYSFKKTNNGSMLICKSIHPLQTQESSRSLNVLYKPIVSVAQKMYTVVEKSKLEIDCIVDSNPPPRIFWKPIVNTAEGKYSHHENKLEIKDINSKMDGIIFQCSAENEIGLSEPESIQLNVLYKPRLVDITKLDPQIRLGSDIRLECKFTGNPKPTIIWTFIDAIYGEEHHPSGSADNPGLLILKNSSYSDEGEYYCRGKNHISLTSEEGIAMSNRLIVDIVGKPQFLQQRETLEGYQNTNTRIEKIFCSDPPPTKVQWIYDGSIQHNVDLNVKGKNSDRKLMDMELGNHINAGPLVPLNFKSTKPTCFRAVLLVLNSDIADTRDYLLRVENGDTSVAEGVVSLQISSKLSGAMVISISLILLIMLFIFTVFFILFLRRRSNKNQNEISGEKSDVHVPINDPSEVEKQPTEKVH